METRGSKGTSGADGRQAALQAAYLFPLLPCGRLSRPPWWRLGTITAHVKHTRMLLGLLFVFASGVRPV